MPVADDEWNLECPNCGFDYWDSDTGNCVYCQKTTKRPTKADATKINAQCPKCGLWSYYDSTAVYCDNCNAITGQPTSSVVENKTTVDSSLPPPSTQPPRTTTGGARIAIVGTEGCGKTVFIATLAQRFNSVDHHTGIFLEKQTRKTDHYINKVWDTLMSGDWPSSTVSEEIFDLKLNFHVNGGIPSDMRLIDCAGQVYRGLFAGEQMDDMERLSGPVREIAEYCNSADIILVMVNLKDFMGEGNREKRSANEWAIKYALGELHARHRALVFTQIDQYSTFAQNLDAAAKEYLPQVYGTHLRNNQVKIMGVSAVSETDLVIQEGKHQRIPRKGFGSIGLIELAVWIKECTREITETANERLRLEKERKEREQREAGDARKKLQAQQAKKIEQVRLEQEAEDERIRQEAENKARKKREDAKTGAGCLGGVIGAVIGFFIGGYMAGGWGAGIFSGVGYFLGNAIGESIANA